MSANLDNLTYLIICTGFPMLCEEKYDIFVQKSITNRFKLTVWDDWLYTLLFMVGRGMYRCMWIQSWLFFFFFYLRMYFYHFARHDYWAIKSISQATCLHASTKFEFLCMFYNFTWHTKTCFNGCKYLCLYGYLHVYLCDKCEIVVSIQTLHAHHKSTWKIKHHIWNTTFVMHVG